MGLIQDFIRVMEIWNLNTGIYVCWLDKTFLFFFLCFSYFFCFTCRLPQLGPLSLRSSTHRVAFPHHFSMLPHHVHFLFQCQYPINDRRALNDSWRAVNQWVLYVMHYMRWSKSSMIDTSHLSHVAIFILEFFSLTVHLNLNQSHPLHCIYLPCEISM